MISERIKDVISGIVLVAALLSLADKSQTAWFAARALGFAAIAILGRSGAFSLAAAFSLIAVAGFAGLDLALAILSFSAFRLRSVTAAWVSGSIGVLGAISMFVFRNSIPMFPFHNRNHYAVFCELTLPLLIYVGTKRSLWPALTAAGVMLLTALAGGSRAGAALLILELSAVAFALGGRKVLAVAVPVLGICALAFCMAIPSERLLDPFRGDHRMEIWQSGVSMFSAHPWTGWGYAEFPRIYPAYAIFDNGEFVNAAHSDWLEWAIEFGILAPVFAVLALASWAKKLIRFYPSWGILVGALHATVDFPFHLPGLLVFAMALAGTLNHHGKAIQTQSTDSPGRGSETS